MLQTSGKIVATHMDGVVSPVLAGVAELQQHAVCDGLAREAGASSAECHWHVHLARNRQDALDLHDFKRFGRVQLDARRSSRPGFMDASSSRAKAMPTSSATSIGRGTCATCAGLPHLLLAVDLHHQLGIEPVEASVGAVRKCAHWIGKLPAFGDELANCLAECGIAPVLDALAVLVLPDGGTLRARGDIAMSEELSRIFLGRAAQ